MGIPRDLDEIPEMELLAEMKRRHEARQSQKCDYCGRPEGQQPACKFPDRHRAKARTTFF